jgi:hypothetical protein
MLLLVCWHPAIRIQKSNTASASDAYAAIYHIFLVYGIHVVHTNKNLLRFSVTIKPFYWASAAHGHHLFLSDTHDVKSKNAPYLGL